MLYSTELVSVIVSIYNEEEYIGRCITSIINQSYNNLDIILVNDGSTDDSLKICKHYVAIDDRIRLINKENGGLVSSRKAGILCAKGDIIVYVDGDDWLEECWIENLYDLLINNDAEIVIAGFKKDLNGIIKKCVNTIASGTYERQNIENEIIPKMMYNGVFFECGIYTYLWNKMFRKHIIKQNQMEVQNEIIIGEDAACVYPSVLSANKVVITEEAGYHYCIRPNSIVRGGNRKDSLKRLQIFYKYMVNKFSNEIYQEILLKQLFYLYVGLVTQMSERLILEYPNLPRTYPFNNVKNGTKIILYSAGAFGTHMYHQFKNNTKLEIVGWTDPFYDKYLELGFDVISLEIVKKKNYDFIIVASIDKKFIEETKDRLIINGIDRNKIITVQNYLDEILSFSKKVINDIGKNNEK